MSEPTDLTAEINSARESFLAQFAEEESASEEAAEGEAVEASEGQGAAAATGGETADAEVKPQEPAGDKEPESRGYRRLLAREAKLREEQKAVDELRKTIEADKAALAEFNKVKERLKLDPVGYLRGAGLSQKEILAALAEAHQEDLGDLAPAETRAALAARKAERIAREAEERLNAQHEAMKAAQQQQEAQKFIAQYQAGIEQFVGTGLTEYPHLAAVQAAGRPVAQALYQTAVEMAAANPAGPAPDYSAVAKQLNDRLAELASVTQVPNPTASAPSATPNVAASSKPVLRNNVTQAQPSAAPEPPVTDYREYVENLRSKVLSRHGIAQREEW